MSPLTIFPVKKVSGRVRVPGDKSISHRALILGALARGKTVIHGISTAQDVSSTRACLEAMGVDIRHRADRVLEVEGKGLRGWHPPGQTLEAGNSGTTIRMLAGALAGQSFRSVLDGDASVRRRPMDRVVHPLAMMGASVESSPGGVAPLKITGRPLKGIRYRLPVASAQVKSAVLLAGLFAEGKTIVTEPESTRDHTEILLQLMGVPIETAPRTVGLIPCQPRAVEINIPGDFSSAAYFLAAGVLAGDPQVSLEGVGVNPTRRAFLDVLGRMGASIGLERLRRESGEMVADLSAARSDLNPFDVRGDDIPNLIDELPLLAVLASRASGVSRIREARELRVKESDRLEATAGNLERMGVRVERYDDGLDIYGPSALHGAVIQTFGDHRIAMAFAVAGLLAKGETTLDDPACVAVSFPDFFEQMDAIKSTRTLFD